MQRCRELFRRRSSFVRVGYRVSTESVAAGVNHSFPVAAAVPAAVSTSAARMSSAGFLERSKIQDARRSEILDRIQAARLFLTIEEIAIPIRLSEYRPFGQATTAGSRRTVCQVTRLATFFS